MPDTLTLAAVALLAFLLGWQWRDIRWRIWQYMPLRCSICGKWCQTRHTTQAQSTTGLWLPLCRPCFRRAYQPFTDTTP
jgi:hypothetical protein